MISIVPLAALITVLIVSAVYKPAVNSILSEPLVDQKTLHTLAQKNGSSAVTTHIAAGIIPPTNSWISGMVLQSTPLPVYPMPSSFLAKDSGFEVGQPTIQSTATVITGEHVPGIIASINNSSTFKLIRYDKVSASLTYYDATNHAIGLLTLAEGSPFVFFHSSSSTTINLSNLGVVSKDSTESYLRYTLNGHDYAVVAGKGATIKQTGSNASISIDKDSLVTLYSVPNGRSDQLRSLAGNELTSVNISSAQQQGSSLTTLTYNTSNNKPTVFVPMAYSKQTNKTSVLGTYDSIYGPMNGTIGNSFTSTVPLASASNSLDLSHISASHKQELITNLKKDVSTTSIDKTDSYYAGKQLSRAATLLDISEQLGQTDSTNQLKSILIKAFSTRLNANYFYYDTTLKGIVAQNKSFGSEDFNDHHFHYGYFIYAASILGKYDSNFVSNYKNQINLLVADIASYQQTNDVPVSRYYDPYVAHSWAAGLAPFADGNNQESSSEAINAWNGIAKWAQLTNNAELQSSATWMLSGESATASAAWRTTDTDASYLKSYTSPLSSLNFGGKRTYSTFFSDEPNAKLGIQLLPMSPMMTSFKTDKAAIARNVSSSIKNDNYNVALGDYILMYLALSDPQKASSELTKQQDAFIDDGNSRTYLNAWVYSLTD
ncbi:MAG: Endo,3(4)-beta-glucanase [Candidatus Saccharibacteria bacterium]|nr:Endo,3(4)-beta-glucanase [Candidatus Saccharibacteria bacterium]